MLKDLIEILAAFFLLWVLFGALGPRDDTDPPGSRSGLGLYIDERTGCQYLRAGLFGSATPRLDEHGKQICERRKP